MEKDDAINDIGKNNPEDCGKCDGKSIDPICGSDNRTYVNECTLQWTNCKNGKKDDEKIVKTRHEGVKYLGFFLLLFPQNERKNILVLLSLYIFWGKLSIFEIMGFFDMNVNFIIQKLKSKHTSLKNYTNWAKLVHFSLFLRSREEKKKNISHPKNSLNLGVL